MTDKAKIPIFRFTCGLAVAASLQVSFASRVCLPWAVRRAGSIPYWVSGAPARSAATVAGPLAELLSRNFLELIAPKLPSLKAYLNSLTTRQMKACGHTFTDLTLPPGAFKPLTKSAGL